jgi:formylglycine-generating enzyme
MIAIGIVLSRCSMDNGSGNVMETYSAEAISFRMSYVPGGISFPTETDDSGTSGVANAYLIGETEVTYELWYKVYSWATDAARGAQKYVFENKGCEGSDGTAGAVPSATSKKNEPVTNVSWSDAIAWCNALTEWYNANNTAGKSFSCVYKDAGAPLRDGTDYLKTTGVDPDASAAGFRLPARDEWECAARFIDGATWLPGDHASGDLHGYCFPAAGASTWFGYYAVYSGNAGSKTAEVKSRLPNARGIYDMSGNVWEWCFEGNNYYRSIRGGSWYDDAISLQVGSGSADYPYAALEYLGFRVSRTQ